MRILLIIPPNVTGVEYHRLLIPHSNLHGAELNAINAIDYQPDSFFQDFDIIVTSSVLSKIGNQELAWAQVKKVGIPVVIDRDDSWTLPKYHPMYHEWVNSKRAEQIIYNIKKANAVTCTNDYLKNIIGNYNKNVVTIPNGIDFKQPQFEVDEKVKGMKTNHVHIGWSGSVTHHQDLKLLETPLIELNGDLDLKGKYRLILSGYIENDTTWKDYERIFTNNWKIDKDQYARINGMDVNTYASGYDLMDVGLIPLIDDQFNRCKSNLKMLEMGAKSLACVVSNQYPYTNIAKHEKNCLIAEKRTWHKQIKRLIQSSQLRIDLSNKLYEEVKQNWNITNFSEKRLNLYNNLIKNAKR